MWKNSLFLKSRKAEKVGYNVYTHTHTHTEVETEKIFIYFQVTKIKGGGNNTFFFIFTTLQEQR